jgi:hypothetical protein
MIPMMPHISPSFLAALIPFRASISAKISRSKASDQFRRLIPTRGLL